MATYFLPRQVPPGHSVITLGRVDGACPWIWDVFVFVNMKLPQKKRKHDTVIPDPFFYTSRCLLLSSLSVTVMYTHRITRFWWVLIMTVASNWTSFGTIFFIQNSKLRDKDKGIPQTDISQSIGIRTYVYIYIYLHIFTYILQYIYIICSPVPSCILPHHGILNHTAP